MLDNLLYLLTDTVLPQHFFILLVQIILIWFAKRKNNRLLWIVLYAVIIGSIVFSCAATFMFESEYGIGRLADVFISIAGSIVYPVMLWIASIVKDR